MGLTVDPLAELVAALRADGKPPLSWITEHAPDGSLQRLWDACVEPEPMLRLIGRTEGARYAYAAAIDACQCSRTDHENLLRCVSRKLWEFPVSQIATWIESGRAVPWLVAAAIRRAVPHPPTLAEVIERGRGA